MMAFFWVLWILAGAFVVHRLVNYVRMAREIIKVKQFLKEAKQKLEDAKEDARQLQFNNQCWQARLRRETEPTGIVEHELNGHNYIAISHSVAEVPALYLSMQRMMMEVESEREISGKGGMLVVNGQNKEWSTTSNQFKGKSFSFTGRYMRD